jgi:acyl-CoA synthetase (AMP-forming)/AMP-acid ligase II
MPIRSPYPDVKIPNVSEFDYLFADLAEKASRVAVIDSTNGSTTTFGELAHRIERFAAALAHRGIGRGDTVAIFAPNTPDYAVVFHGTLLAGATITTVNALYTPHDLAGQLIDSKAGLLFTVSAFLDRAKAALAEDGGARVGELIVLDGAEGHRSLADLLDNEYPVPQVEINPAEDIAVLPYSSGTTGRPKGVMLTHRNLVANIAQYKHATKVNQDSVVLAVLPFFHIYGMQICMNGPIYFGCATVTMPRFDLADFLRVIEEYKVTHAYIAPPIAVALAKHPIVAKYDLSSLQALVSGAAALSAELAAEVKARIGCEVMQGYGMTELSPVSHTSLEGRPDIPVSTVGSLIPNMQAKIVDPESGTELGVGERGELWCRGPNVMVGYLNNDEATAETIDADGYLHTGDVASVDEQGYFTILDRVKELIKYHGYQVPPAELEALLLTHPEIADSAVIGVLDEEGEEIPKAFVVRRPGVELTEQDVMTFVADRVAPHKKVRQVEFIDVIPKSSSGKILRKDLRDQVAVHS